MVQRIKVSEQIIVAAKAYLTTNNLGNRGVEDGNRRKQFVGLIGELVLIEFLTGTVPDLKDKIAGFDGGFDLLFNGYRIDIKTMERRSYVKPDFVNNFYLLQQSFNVDIIVFCSLHSADKVVEICGWIPKDELTEKGKFYAAGTKRLRADGSSFTFRQDNYEVENKDLNDISDLKKIVTKPT